MDAQRRWGRAAAAAAMVLGAAHLVITGGFLFTGAQEPTVGYLAWVFIPVLVALVFSAAASALASPRGARGRWPLWVGGTAAVSTGALTIIGFAPLAMGADPISLFLGPGPYALPCAILFTALTLGTVRRRRASRNASTGTTRGPEREVRPLRRGARRILRA
ncbi:MAG TPA: hypothetical protein K8V84_01550 [Nocardiopsis listeri]|uniref:hypothetical protein n=1 Tax=Nocardiopsis listeri TaxID=53440 RepID=UPI001D8A7175|nr:hypothetical protein [Nocardiopsis listeri]HJE57190.1 hypothetical protein [Nocardiopsis listeri]